MTKDKLASLLEHITLLKNDLESIPIEDSMPLGIYWSNPVVIAHLKNMQQDVYNELKRVLTKEAECVILGNAQQGGVDDGK